METEYRYDEALKKAREIFANAKDGKDYYDPRSPQQQEACFVCDMLESIFGREALEPQLNTWEDLVNAGKVPPHDNYCFSLTDSSSPLNRKCAATYQIAHLIMASYGGLLKGKEWADCNKWKYVIRPTTPTHQCLGVECQGENGTVQVCKVTNRSKYRFVAFRSREQAERFLKYNYNLICNYYMLPGKAEDDGK